MDGFSIPFAVLVALNRRVEHTVVVRGNKFSFGMMRSILNARMLQIDKKADLSTINLTYSLQDNIYNQWYRVTEIYAHLRLTERTDRLPALAGVAQQFQSLPRDTYLSGIWKSELLLYMACNGATFL